MTAAPTRQGPVAVMPRRTADMVVKEPVFPVVAAPAVEGPDARTQAYDQLLSGAAGRNDRGASSQMMADILNGVDMGRADRVRGLWSDRNTAMSGAGTTMLDAYSKALAAQRARVGSGRRSGGGGGGGGPVAAYQPQGDWLDQYLAMLSGNTPRAPYNPTTNRGSAGGGRPFTVR